MRKLKKNISLLVAALMVAFFMQLNNIQAFAYTQVIDVYDGDDLEDFQAIKDSGIEGIVTKVSQGCTGIQRNYDYRYHKCKETGIPIGFYHWLSSHSQPESQAEVFYDLIKSYDMDIIPMLDIEAGEGIYREQWDVVNVEDYANRFISRFKQLSGLDMIIYSGRAFIEENFSEAFCSCHNWWVAEYGVNSPKNVSKCGNWSVWQYTDCGRVNGVIGDVDRNTLYQTNNFYLKDYQPIKNTTHTVVNCDNLYSQLQQELNRQGFGNLDVDGIPGPLTLNACPLIHKGAEGNITQWIQLRIGATPDGEFGENTRQAVKWFQESRGLIPDGIVGENTWYELLGM